MRDSSGLDDFPCELLLNGVCMRSVKIRQTVEPGSDFDVVVTDPVLGPFSLHSGFEIELHEADSSWRRVSLPELVRDTSDLVERHFIKAALELTGDNRTTAADLLGLSRQSLYVKLRRHGLQLDEGADDGERTAGSEAP